MKRGGLVDIGASAWKAWDADSGILLAGGLAFFAALSMSPLLVVAVTIVQNLLGQKAAGAEFYAHLAPVVGDTAARALADMVARSTTAASSQTATAIALLVALFGAGGLFLQVRASLDIVFGDPRPTGMRGTLGELVRASMALFAVGLFAVLASGLWAAVNTLSGSEPGRVAGVLEFLGTAALAFVLLGFGYRFLPKGKAPWAAAWAGGAVATIVAAASTVGFMLYLGLGFAASTYGAAASFFVFLMWLWFLGIGFVIGAETAHEWQRLRSLRGLT